MARKVQTQHVGARPRPHGLGRTIARLGAVQALYQIALSGDGMEDVLHQFLLDRREEETGGVRLGDMDGKLFALIVRGVCREEALLDDLLAAVLDTEWALERLEIVLLVILRCGAFELARRPDVPARVIISEYVDLGHAFFSGREPGMINGMLDRLSRHLRPGELAVAAGGSRITDAGAR